MLRLTFAAIVPLALLVANGPDGSSSDADAIKKTALNYGMGWYEGDDDRMESALHHDLAKRALFPDARSKKGKVEHMSAMRLVQATRQGSGKRVPAERRADVTILEVYGNTAQVKLIMQDWVDYMQMVKIGGEWKIVNVLWEFTPEAKERYGIPSEL